MYKFVRPYKKPNTNKPSQSVNPVDKSISLNKSETENEIKKQQKKEEKKNTDKIDNERQIMPKATPSGNIIYTTNVPSSDIIKQINKSSIVEQLEKPSFVKIKRHRSLDVKNDTDTISNITTFTEQWDKSNVCFRIYDSKNDNISSSNRMDLRATTSMKNLVHNKEERNLNENNDKENSLSITAKKQRSLQSGSLI